MCIQKNNPPLSVIACANAQSLLSKSNLLISNTNLSIASLLLQKF